MRAVLAFLQNGGLTKEGIEETDPVATPATTVDQPAVDVDSIDGISDSSVIEAEQELEQVEADSPTADVSAAIGAATELDDLQQSLEAICDTRVPTAFELKLVRKAAVQAFQNADLEWTGRSHESGDLGNDAVLTQEDLRSASEAVWGAIKKALAKISESLAKAWHAFVFWLKPAQKQITQFLGELSKFEGDPKFTQLRLKPKPAVYVGLGIDQSPIEVIKALEAANKYVYTDLFYQVSQFASTGTPVPKIDDEQFALLPCSPRFRAGTNALHFLEQPPMPKNLNVLVPELEVMKEWCQAFLDESMYFITNYESFKSTAEKIYDAVRDEVDDVDNPDAADLMDAGSKVLFARSHSCVEAMEAWVWYAVRVMTAHHATLLAMRKAFI